MNGAVIMTKHLPRAAPEFAVYCDTAQGDSAPMNAVAFDDIEPPIPGGKIVLLERSAELLCIYWASSGLV